ncbi:MAG TPA: hypothetical protein VJ868_01770 [Actinomycetota bacterium]|nr:hypothetical protein [Actinomycetota bacterium]
MVGGHGTHPPPGRAPDANRARCRWARNLTISLTTIMAVLNGITFTALKLS